MLLCIDPGNTSALCIMDAHGVIHLLELVDVNGDEHQRTKAMMHWCQRAVSIGAAWCIIERQFVAPTSSGADKQARAAAHARRCAAMNLQAISSAWVTCAIASGLQIPTTKQRTKGGAVEAIAIRPMATSWRKMLGISNAGSSAEIKKRTINFVQVYFPHISDHNQADAICMALAYRPAMKHWKLG